MTDKSDKISISLPESLLTAMDQHVAALDSDRSKYIRELVTTDLSLAGLLPGSVSAENAKLAAELSREKRGAEMVSRALRRAAASLGQKEVAA